MNVTDDEFKHHHLSFDKNETILFAAEVTIS